MRLHDVTVVDISLDDVLLDWNEDYLIRLHIASGERTVHEQTLLAGDLFDQPLEGAWWSGYCVRIPLGAAARAALRSTSGALKFRVTAPAMDPLRSEFHLVTLDATTQGRLASVRKRLQTAPRWLVLLLQAQVLLDAECPAVAVDLVQQALALRPTEAHAAALLYTALVEAGLYRSHVAGTVFDDLVVEAYIAHRQGGAQCALVAEATPAALARLQLHRDSRSR